MSNPEDVVALVEMPLAEALAKAAMYGEDAGKGVPSVSRTLAAEVSRLSQRVGEMERELEDAQQSAKFIHQFLKRGEATTDHGLLGNLGCVIDHLVDAALTPDAGGKEKST